MAKVVVWAVLAAALVLNGCASTGGAGGSDAGSNEAPALSTLPEGTKTVISLPGGGPEFTMITAGKAVIRPLAISETEITYEVWYAVYQWAVSNGYAIAHQGRAGWVTADDPPAGEAPDDANRNQPAIDMTLRDALVWCNALSEMTGLSPAYRASDGTVLKDSNGDDPGMDDPIFNAAELRKYSGYRLPSNDQWYYAARGGRLTGDAGWNENNAWWKGNGGDITHEVKGKAPNDLGLYDCWGNVWEYVQPYAFSDGGGAWTRGNSVLDDGGTSHFQWGGSTSSGSYRVWGQFPVGIRLALP